MTAVRDLRVKITAEAWAALKAESHMSGREQTEIVRTILHEWAETRIKFATLLNANLVSEGLPGIGGGDRGPPFALRGDRE